VGYQLVLPKPDPINGPAPPDGYESQIDTLSWLHTFPDSRSQPATEPAQHRKLRKEHPSEKQKSDLEPIGTQQSRLQELASAAFHFYATHVQAIRK
jgi:hypothetical protein